MSREVITATPDEPIEVVAKKMEDHQISALPVLNGRGQVIGLITSESISMLIGRCRP